MNQALKVVLIAALLIIVARLLVAQRVVFQDSLRTSGVAYVDCDSLGRPTIYTSPNAPHSSWWTEILAHEQHHIQQMKTAKLSCTEYMVKFKADQDFRLFTEAEAYCVGILADTAQDWKAQTASVVERLHYGYSLDQSPDSIEVIFTNICKEVSNGRQRQAAPP